MASDGDRLRAEQMFIEEGASPSDIARTLSIARSSVYKWRDEGTWLLRRKQFADGLGHARTAGALEAARTAGAANVLSRIRGLELAAAIAEDDKLEPRDRLAAIKLAATIEGWAEEGLGGSASAQGKGGDVPRGVIELPAFDAEPVPPPDEPGAGGAP